MKCLRFVSVLLVSALVICKIVSVYTSGSKCGVTNTCHTDADCVNILGTDQCSCKPGFSGDGISCNDIYECELLSHICDSCDNRPGWFDCYCEDGHYGGWFRFQSDLDKDGYNLKLEPFNNASCPFLPFKCIEEPPNSCRCPYNFSNIGFNCMVIDGCISGQNDCHVNATCDAAQNGSYTCQCNSGFTGSGFQCTDVDECESFQPPCTNNCINTIGGYSCSCLSGYDGDHCTDIDECSEETHSCHPRATCTNTDGGYYCTCDGEYYVEGDNGTWCSGCINDSWTPWTDFDHGYDEYWPDQIAVGMGDFETINLARKSYPNFALCENPTNIDVRLSNFEPYYKGGDKVHLSIDGFYCLNNEQDDLRCHNYHVRFCCPGSTENEFDSSTQTDKTFGSTTYTETSFDSSTHEDTTSAFTTTIRHSTYTTRVKFASGTDFTLVPTTNMETTFDAIEHDSRSSALSTTTHVATYTTDLVFDSNTQSKTSAGNSPLQTTPTSLGENRLLNILDSPISEIASEYTCVTSLIMIVWTKSSIGSGYFYRLQAKDLKTREIKETSVQLFLPKEAYIKTTSSSSEGCITTTTFSVSTTDVVKVKVFAGKLEDQIKTISKVIYLNKGGKQTYELTFVDLD